MATSKAQINIGTALLFNGVSGTADVDFSFENTADGEAQVSAQHDLGASPRDFQFNWSAEALGVATPTIDSVVNFYAVGAPDSDSTQIDGDVGSSDASDSTPVEVANLKYIGSLVWDTADTSKMVGSGSFTHTDRYLSIYGVNEIGSAINATDSNFILLITPFDIQGQAT